MQTWFDAQLDQKILDGIYSEMSRLNKDLFSYSKIHPLKNGTFGSQFSND